MLQRITLSFLGLLVPCLIFAQTKTAGKRSYQKQIEILSRQQIKDLHNGVLLVRLKTKKPSIDALRKAGKTKMADQLQMEQEDLNKEIIREFRSEFKFCPTYFFFSEYSPQVRDKRFDKVVFLNSLLQPDSNIKFTGQKFLTAEFGNVEQDTAKFSAGQYDINDANGYQKKNAQYGSSNMGFGALVIRSDQFIQLKKPFPYYARTLASVAFRRTTKQVVKLMNKQLTKFYEKQQ